MMGDNVTLSVTSVYWAVKGCSSAWLLPLEGVLPAIHWQPDQGKRGPCPLSPVCICLSLYGLLFSFLFFNVEFDAFFLLIFFLSPSSFFKYILRQRIWSSLWDVAILESAWGVKCNIHVTDTSPLIVIVTCRVSVHSWAELTHGGAGVDFGAATGWWEQATLEQAIDISCRYLWKGVNCVYHHPITNQWSVFTSQYLSWLEAAILIMLVNAMYWTCL